MLPSVNVNSMSHIDESSGVELLRTCGITCGEIRCTISYNVHSVYCILALDCYLVLCHPSVCLYLTPEYSHLYKNIKSFEPLNISDSSAGNNYKHVKCVIPANCNTFLLIYLSLIYPVNHFSYSFSFTRKTGAKWQTKI